MASITLSWLNARLRASELHFKTEEPFSPAAIAARQLLVNAINTRPDEVASAVGVLADVFVRRCEDAVADGGEYPTWTLLTRLQNTVKRAIDDNKLLEDGPPSMHIASEVFRQSPSIDSLHALARAAALADTPFTMTPEIVMTKRAGMGQVATFVRFAFAHPKAIASICKALAKSRVDATVELGTRRTELGPRWQRSAAEVATITIRWSSGHITLVERVVDDCIPHMVLEAA